MLKGIGINDFHRQINFQFPYFLISIRSSTDAPFDISLCSQRPQHLAQQIQQPETVVRFLFEIFFRIFYSFGLVETFTRERS